MEEKKGDVEKAVTEKKKFVHLRRRHKKYSREKFEGDEEKRKVVYM